MITAASRNARLHNRCFHFSGLHSYSSLHKNAECGMESHSTLVVLAYNFNNLREHNMVRRGITIKLRNVYQVIVMGEERDEGIRKFSVLLVLLSFGRLYSAIMR